MCWPPKASTRPSSAAWSSVGSTTRLKGTAYAVVDGVDGRTHHIKLADLDAAGDSAPGSIVELRAYDDSRGQRRVALAVRSDLDIERQVTASGATWLDRHNIAREPAALSESGFGAEVRDALDRRADHLIEEGFAERQGRRIVFSRNLIDTLRRREVEDTRREAGGSDRAVLPARSHRRICRRHVSPAPRRSPPDASR